MSDRHQFHSSLSEEVSQARNDVRVEELFHWFIEVVILSCCLSPVFVRLCLLGGSSDSDDSAWVTSSMMMFIILLYLCRVLYSTTYSVQTLEVYQLAEEVARVRCIWCCHYELERNTYTCSPPTDDRVSDLSTWSWVADKSWALLAGSLALGLKAFALMNCSSS